MNCNRIRQSNFELMRIISMFFIVLWHIIIHGHLIENSLNPKFSFIMTLLKYIVIVHVNSYVLLTGYFQCKSKFKLSKIWDLSISSLFYKLIIKLILLAVIIFPTVFLLKASLTANSILTYTEKGTTDYKVYLKENNFDIPDVSNGFLGNNPALQIQEMYAKHEGPVESTIEYFVAHEANRLIDEAIKEDKHRFDGLF